MSVASDQMPGLTGVAPGVDPNIQQFQDLEGQAASVEQAAAANTAQTAQTLSTMQPPQRDTGIFSQAPLLIALTALGGKAIGLHARTMLGATNGMVKGMLMGNQQAYDDAVNQYKENRQKLLDTWDLQQKYYETLYHSYADRADAKLKAIQAARALTNDEWTHQYKDMLAQQKQGMDEFKSYMLMQNYIEKVRNDNLEDKIRQQNADTARMNANTRAQQVEQKLGTLKGPDGIKQIHGMMADLQKEMNALRNKNLGILSEEDKPKYEELLATMARLNIREQELMNDKTQPAAGGPSAAGGGPRPSVGAGVDPATGEQGTNRGLISRGGEGSGESPDVPLPLPEKGSKLLPNTYYTDGKDTRQTNSQGTFD